MLDHRTEGHVAQPFAGQPVLVDQCLKDMGHHVLIGAVSIGGMGACKRDSQATHDHHRPGGLITHTEKVRRWSSINSFAGVVTREIFHEGWFRRCLH